MSKSVDFPRFFGWSDNTDGHPTSYGCCQIVVTRGLDAGAILMRGSARFGSSPGRALVARLCDDGLMGSVIEVRIKFAINDVELSGLHARAFDVSEPTVLPWAARLLRYSVSWVGAFEDDRLVGFVHACGDGGAHAFVLDTVVDPAYQRRGIGRALLEALRTEVLAAGCEWLHVDFEAHLRTFYEACGFRPTQAGLLRLT